MKIKFIIPVLFLSVALFSCKDDKKTEEVTAPKEEVKDNSFKVTFDLIAKKDDNFHLYYTEDETINFNEKQSVWVPIKGRETEQEVVFKLPENSAPTHLRVDFGYGVNKEQKEIVLKKFKMNYYDKSFEAKDSLIFNYFYPNKDNTILDNKLATLRRIKEDQSTAPSIYPHIPLTDELNKMVRH